MSEEKKCKACHGYGQIIDAEDGDVEMCPKCNGSGDE